ncbi:hypothetical protein CRG98_036747 [Punica granatum]|uniref:Uncharacterized protein n=1 Tax=Punica granatum TaxID=22663 RepID=A0A2I0IG35_PUNGR|nr:hypothetical protein CRG98_036747 [Punica granatum]
MKLLPLSMNINAEARETIMSNTSGYEYIPMKSSRGAIKQMNCRSLIKATAKEPRACWSGGCTIGWKRAKNIVRSCIQGGYFDEELHHDSQYNSTATTGNQKKEIWIVVFAFLHPEIWLSLAVPISSVEGAFSNLWEARTAASPPPLSVAADYYKKPSCSQSHRNLSRKSDQENVDSKPTSSAPQSSKVSALVKLLEASREIKTQQWYCEC